MHGNTLYLSLDFVNSPVFINSEVWCIWRQVTVENYFWLSDPKLRSIYSCQIGWGMPPGKKPYINNCCFVLWWVFLYACLGGGGFFVFFLFVFVFIFQVVAFCCIFIIASLLYKNKTRQTIPFILLRTVSQFRLVHVIAPLQLLWIILFIFWSLCHFQKLILICLCYGNLAQIHSLSN